MKKPAGSVRFRFYKQKTEKIEPNRTQTVKKPEKKTKSNRKNRAKPKNLAKTGKNQVKTEPNRFEPGFAQKTGLDRNRSV